MHDGKIRVRIRGIFSTALTKFFIDNGFEITQPSPPICERFNIQEPNYLSPHVDIQTVGSRARIECLQRHTEKIKELLLENFEDIVVHQQVVAVNSVWKGIVTKCLKDGYLVRYSVNANGFLPKEETSQQYHEGDLVIVEIRDYDKKNKRAILTDMISIPGEFVVLIKKETIKVSRKIRGSKKIELMDIGNILRPPGWGAIFRTSAMYADIEEISDEMEKLKDYTKNLMKDAAETPAFTQIREGINILVAYFPMRSKRRLDKLRSEVTITLENHHWLKTISKATSYLVDFIENKLSKLPGFELDKISALVSEHIKESVLPKVGDVIRINHLKPSMRKVILGPARIIDLREKDGHIEYVLFRKFGPGGYYDGINAPKEAGDYGITFAREGDTKLVTAYFDMNSNLKGIYVNINTPIEIYPQSIRYVDLEVDVVRTINEEIMILDRQKLDKYVEQKVIPKTVYEETHRLSEEYKEWLEKGGVEEILDECNSIRDLIALEISP